MQIKTSDAELRVDDSLMRVYVAAPRPEGKYPGILLYSEIFQLTGPIIRSANRLAGHGFVVAAPEIYHRIEPVGTVIGYDDLGRMRGNEGAKRTRVAEFDADGRATLDYLEKHPQVAAGKLGTMGFCIGGHLAMRAALDPQVKAGVCCYPTGVHSGKLGEDADAGTLGRLGEIKGELLVVFGDVDPHVSAEGRKAVAEALVQAGVKHRVLTVGGEHAFMRDEGPRYDAAAADQVYGEAIGLFKRALA
jgi:carboxymethylenebutenolidase